MTCHGAQRRPPSLQRRPGTALSPLMTTGARAANFAIPPTATGNTSVVDGFLYIPYLVIEAVTALGAAGLALIGIVILALLLGFRAYAARWEVLAGADADDLEAERAGRPFPAE